MKHEHVDHDQSVEAARTGPPLKLIALLIVVAALAAFFFQNGQDAPVEFLWLDGSWPVWAVIGVSVLFGIVIDRLVGWLWRRARR